MSRPLLAFQKIAALLSVLEVHFFYLQSVVHELIESAIRFISSFKVSWPAGSNLVYLLTEGGFSQMSGCCFLLDLSFRAGIDWNQKQLWIYWNLQSKSTLELRADFNGPNGSKLKDEHAHRLVHQTERQLSRSSDVLFTLRDDITPTVRPTLQSPRGWAGGRVGSQPSHWHSGLPRVPKTGADTGAAWPGNWTAARCAARWRLS